MSSFYYFKCLTISYSHIMNFSHFHAPFPSLTLPHWNASFQQVSSLLSWIFCVLCPTEFNYSCLHGWEIIYWSKDNLSVATPLKKMIPSSPGNINSQDSLGEGGASRALRQVINHMLLAMLFTSPNKGNVPPKKGWKILLHSLASIIYTHLLHQDRLNMQILLEKDKKRK